MGETLTEQRRVSEEGLRVVKLCCKGRRPSFIDAAKPDISSPLYDYFNESLRNQGIHVETGIFGADMKCALINDGPVTILLDSDDIMPRK